jgi:hypothetical protein
VDYSGTHDTNQFADYNETELNNMTKNETKDSDLPCHTTDPRGGGGG